MDVCADPAPPPDPDADDPAEEAAFFRALIRRAAVVAAELIEDIHGTDQLTLDKKAGSVDRLGRLVTRNALAARQLRQPLRAAPSPRPPPANPAPRRGATPPVDNRPLSKLTDAELAAANANRRRAATRSLRPSRSKTSASSTSSNSWNGPPALPVPSRQQRANPHPLRLITGHRSPATRPATALRFAAPIRTPAETVPIAFCCSTATF